MFCEKVWVIGNFKILRRFLGSVFDVVCCRREPQFYEEALKRGAGIERE